MHMNKKLPKYGPAIFGFKKVEYVTLVLPKLVHGRIPFEFDINYDGYYYITVTPYNSNFVKEICDVLHKESVYEFDYWIHVNE